MVERKSEEDKEEGGRDAPSHIRISEKTWGILDNLGKKLSKDTGRKSADATIRWMWGKLSQKGQQLSKWKNISGCEDPEELQKKLASLVEKIKESQSSSGDSEENEDSDEESDDSSVSTRTYTTEELKMKLGIN